MTQISRITFFILFSFTFTPTLVNAKVVDLLWRNTDKKDRDTTPNERFNDIIGHGEIKAELMKVVEYISSPDIFDSSDIKIQCGYIFAGPPRVGKTLTTKALTGEINAALKELGKNTRIRLFQINSNMLISKGVTHYMNLARDKAPCILLLDELDLLQLHNKDPKLLNEFLRNMNRTLNKDKKSQIIIIAEINKLKDLEFTLRQHEQIGKIFWFNKLKVKV